MIGDTVGKSRRAVSMVLPKSVSEAKEQPAIEANVDKIDSSAQQLVSVDKTEPQNGKSNTAVQTSFDLLPQLRCEQQQQQQQQKKNLQHLQNISIVKTPLSRLRPSTRTAEQKRLDYERTIAELKKQAIEVENRVRKQQQLHRQSSRKDDWTMDSNNNKQQATAKLSKYSQEEEDSEIDRISCPSPPPPPILRASESLSQQQQQRLLLFDSSALPQPAFQPTSANSMPTAEELILRVNQLSYEPTTDQQIPPPYLPNNLNQLNQLSQAMKTTSTVRVQSQFRSKSGSTFSHYLPSEQSADGGGAKATALHKQQSDNSIKSKEIVAEKNRAYHQRVPSWSAESALLASSAGSSEKDALYEQFARISLDRRAEDEKQQFESKESLIIEESASENEEDSSAAIYKKIIISLRNSSTDLADCDYQASRHSSHSAHRPHHSHFHHQHSSSTTSSSNQHASSHTQSDHHHHHHPTAHTYQTNYAAYYEQMQQLHQLAHQPLIQRQPEAYYFQQQPTTLATAADYSEPDNVDEQEEELISAFSSMSRSEPSSARQSRKY